MIKNMNFNYPVDETLCDINLDYFPWMFILILKHVHNEFNLNYIYSQINFE